MDSGSGASSGWHYHTRAGGGVKQKEGGTQGYAVLVSGLYNLYQGTRKKAWAKRQRADKQAV